MSVSTTPRDATSVHRAHTTVPWLTVVPVAVAMSFADGYWMTSLRGAFGAIERTQDPVGSWVRESTVLVPAFVVAVLAALVVSLRRFGPSPRGRAVSLTAALVAVAGSAVGLGALGVSTAYDYLLETSQLEVMDSMRDLCTTGDCLGLQRDATLTLQERSVAMGAGLMLLTNLALVAWWVAARGGRLRVATTRPAAPAGRSRADDLRAVLVWGLVGSGVIHAAVVPEHWAEWPAAGAFFVALTAAELVAAALLLRRGRPVLAVPAAALVSLVPLVLWLWSRTTGLPFGPAPGVAEAVGLADVGACVLEVLTLVLAITLHERAGLLRLRPAALPHVRGIAVAAALAVATVGFSGTGVAGFDTFGVTPAGTTSAPGHQH